MRCLVVTVATVILTSAMVLPSRGDVTRDLPGSGDPGGVFSGGGGGIDPPAITGGERPELDSPPPLDHMPETLEKPTVVGRMDPGRLEPVAAEASRIDHGIGGGEPDVLFGPAVKDSGLWKTLQEVRLNAFAVVGGALALTAVVVTIIVAISRHGARERGRRLAEAGPPVFFEGDITFEADRDALDKRELQEADDAPRNVHDTDTPADFGPRRRESGLR